MNHVSDLGAPHSMSGSWGGELVSPVNHIVVEASDHEWIGVCERTCAFLLILPLLPFPRPHLPSSIPIYRSSLTFTPTGAIHETAYHSSFSPLTPPPTGSRRSCNSDMPSKKRPYDWDSDGQESTISTRTRSSTGTSQLVTPTIASFDAKYGRQPQVIDTSSGRSTPSLPS
jgi:hypothetical protein